MGRLFANASGDDLGCLEELTKGIPKLESPYTKLKEAIGDGSCNLNMSSWHTCETVHCLAGWTVTLAGTRGKEIEKKFGTEATATFILRASRPEAPLPNFFATDEQATAFINARAAEEHV